MLDGDKIKFDRSWKSSKEANYSHWTRKKNLKIKSNLHLEITGLFLIK